MNIEKKLDQEQAENLLCEFGSRNKKEQEWTKRVLLDLKRSGRHYFTLGSLSKKEFLNLFFKGNPDSKKLVDFEDKIRRDGYNQNCYLFLRDLNPGEKGSYYVENGKHRVTAFRNLIESDKIIYSIVRGIVVSRQPQSRF